jgi:hypothetical protein
MQCKYSFGHATVFFRAGSGSIFKGLGESGLNLSVYERDAWEE